MELAILIIKLIKELIGLISVVIGIIFQARNSRHTEEKLDK